MMFYGNMHIVIYTFIADERKILKQISDFISQYSIGFGGKGSDIFLPKKTDLAPIISIQQTYHIQQCRFSASRFTNDRNKFSFFNFHTEIIENYLFIILLLNILN